MRNIHPDLLDCLRRANPYVELVTELSAPDVSDVLRRVDQFTGVKRVSVDPANSMATSPRGPLSIASGSAILANFPGEQSSFDLNKENPIRRLKGARLQLTPTFVRAILRTVTVRVSRDIFASPLQDWELQIYRVTRTPGVRQSGDPGTPNYKATAWTEYTHDPLLQPAAVFKGSGVTWDGALKATIPFDLTNYGFVLENIPGQAVAADQVGVLPSYYFVVRPVNPPNRDSAYEWLIDTATPRVIAGVGTMERVFWARDGEDDQWQEDLKGDAPTIRLDVEEYQASTQVVFSLDLGRDPTAGTKGRVSFERLLPPGTTASLELSTAGAAGPWVAVKHGDEVAVAQQIYHLRLTMFSDAVRRSSPGATAMGVEFRRLYDVSVESILDLPDRKISVPWLKAAIPDGNVRVLRTGVRDYLDVATTIGSSESPTKLEAEIFLASRHPSVTRDKWLRLERMLVTDREPASTHERFGLSSYAARLQRKVPQKKETISTTHTVLAGSTAAAVLVDPPLIGATASGNEYDNKGYYIRVQQSAVGEFPTGYLQTIQGNTGTFELNFVPALPAALVAGDTIEVHSGVYNTQAITWQDADPADVWWELWTSLAGLAPERIGLGSLPRGGRPPTLADRAPGDVATQNKLGITGKLTEEESAYEIADQLSFIMGGATIEIDGQICFVQIYALRDATGAVTVPLPPVSAVFDPRDYAAPKLPTGIEGRATVLTAKYGKNTAASNPDAYPERITTVVDNEAFAWLAKPEIEDLGIVDLPQKVSRWLYNTADSGLYLATSVARLVVEAAATGLRVFTLPLIEPHPELMPGDSVIVVTDAYTDYDPATQTQLRGWLAVRGIVTGADTMGREIDVFIAGLSDNVTVAGGQVGLLDGIGDELPGGISNIQVSYEDDKKRVYTWTRIGGGKVWAAQGTLATPVANPFAELASGFLPLASDEYTVAKPQRETEATFAYLNWRDDNDVPTEVVWPLHIFPVPAQVPVVQEDDITTPTVRARWIRLQERAIRVVAVYQQIEYEDGSFTPWSAPARKEGNVSLVRPGSPVMGPGEWEHDAPPGGFLNFGYVLETGQFITLLPLHFRRPRAPRILSAEREKATVRVIAGGDAKSIRLFRVFTITLTAAAAQGATALATMALPWEIPVGTVLDFGGGRTATTTAIAFGGGVALTVAALAQAIPNGSVARDIEFSTLVSGTSPPSWEHWLDGTSTLSGGVDVSQVGTNGAVGVAADVPWELRAEAYAAPRSAVTALTERSRWPESIIAKWTAAGGSGGSGGVGGGGAAEWTQVTAAAPAAEGSGSVTLTLLASAAPANHTAHVRATREENGVVEDLGDVTSQLTPALTVPPTDYTDYAFAGATRRTANPAVTYRFTAEIKDTTTGQIIASRSASVDYYTGTPSWGPGEQPEFL